MRLKYLQIAVIACSLAVGTTSITTAQDSSIYRVDGGVAFDIGNNGASDFTFDWTDPSEPFDSFTNVPDPTVEITVGETYAFQRTTSAHPFVIMDNSAASFMTGTDGSYSRTTTSGALIDDATLKPIDDFTASPGPTTDLISWTPSTTGDF